MWSPDTNEYALTGRKISGAIKRTGPLPLKLLLFSLPLLFALSVAGRGFSAVVLDRVVAVVNEEAITWTELYRAMEFEMSNSSPGLTDEEKRELFRKKEAEFLESMIDERLQLQEARKLGIKVGPEEVDRAIEGIRKKISMDEETFQRAIRKEGFTPDDYREMIHDQIVIGRLVEREVRGKIKPSEEETPGGAGGEGGVYYGLSQIFFSLTEGGDIESLSGRIAEVMAGLSNGVDFAELAARHSEGPAAQRGGELGFVPKGQLAREFVEALEGLRPGEVSRPFRSRQGVHIVKLNARKDPSELVKEKLFGREYENWLRGLREKSFIEIRLD